MDQPKIISAVLRGGVWEGQIAPWPADASLEARHLDRVLDGLTLTPGQGSATFRLTLTAEILSDGVQTVVLRNPANGTSIASLSLIAGEALEADIRAEVDLLRAELDMLKRAFRRHCVDTGADK